MDELTHLTNYFKESSRVLRTHGTREKVVTKCVKSVKCVKARIITGGRSSRRNERTVPLLRASCRIRTNDPEITNHVLWPTELKRLALSIHSPTLGVFVSESGCKGTDYFGITKTFRGFFYLLRNFSLNFCS